MSQIISITTRVIKILCVTMVVQKYVHMYTSKHGTKFGYTVTKQQSTCHILDYKFVHCSKAFLINFTLDVFFNIHNTQHIHTL